MAQKVMTYWEQLTSHPEFVAFLMQGETVTTMAQNTPRYWEERAYQPKFIAFQLQTSVYQQTFFRKSKSSCKSCAQERDEDIIQLFKDPKGVSPLLKATDQCNSCGDPVPTIKFCPWDHKLWVCNQDYNCNSYMV